MGKSFALNAQALARRIARALAPITTRKFFYYGAATSCAVGIGLGLWLEPPTPRVMKPGSMTPSMIDIPPSPALPDPIPTVPQAASYAWRLPQQIMQAVVEPAADRRPVETQTPQPQPQPQRQLIAQSGPPIELGQPDTAWREREPPPRSLEFRERPRWDRDERAYDRDDDADEEDLPPPRWERPPPRWPSRDGGDAWEREDR